MNLDIIKEKLKDRPVGVIGKRKEFAVLIPLIEMNDGLHVLFEVRGKTINQPGDVCFPGGKMEEGESVIETALRENEEEMGIPQEDVNIIGRFDSLLEVNRLRLHTAVGVIKEETLKKINLNYEVSEYFTVPVKYLLDNEPDYYKGDIIQDDTGFPYEKHGIDPNYKWRKAYQDIYFWHYEGHCIWGLTAAILQWFLEKMSE